MSKKECPLKSGYDIEFQVNSQFFTSMLNGVIKEYLPICESELKDVIPSVFLPILKEIHIEKSTLSDMNDGMLCVDLSTTQNLPISLYIKKDVKENSDFVISINFAKIINKEFPIKLPESIRGNIKSDFQIVYVKGDSIHDDVFAFLANIDIDSNNVNTIDATKTKSFLERGSEYAMGFRPELSGKFSPLLKSYVTGANNINIPSEAEIRKVYLDYGDQCLKLIIKGTYDVFGLIDSLDPDFTITTKLNFRIEDQKLNVDCSTDTKIEKNFLYNIIVILLGALVPGLLGWTAIIGIHANSFIKLATKKLRDQVSDSVDDSLQAPEDYFYYNSNGDAKMERSSKPLTHVNCFPNEPISLFKTNSNSILYSNNCGVQLNYDKITVNEYEGIILQGHFDSINIFETCNDVALVANEGDTLIYRSKDNIEEKIKYVEAKKLVKESERLNSYNFRKTKTGYIRDIKGKIPLIILPKPIAVRIQQGVNIRYKFPNGFECSTQRLISYIDEKLILIEDVIVAHRGDTRYLKTEQDSTESNNLDNLPPY